MNRLTTIGALSIAILLPAYSIAQSAKPEPPYSSAFKTCDDASQTPGDSVACLNTEIMKWDKRLTIAYQAVIQKFTADDKDLPLAASEGWKGTRVTLLRSAERAWIAFRDADCVSASSAGGGGSSAAVTNGYCQLDHIIERTLVMERLQKD